MQAESRKRFQKNIFPVGLHLFVNPFLHLKFRLAPVKKQELPETFLLVANHTGNFDPFILARAINRQTYYVVTEHLFSLGFKTRLLKFFLDPIPRPKGGNAAGAVMEILRRLKEGSSVTLFAEGNTCWDGCTAGFPEATGKMARSARVPLITFRLEGGYLANPRWSYSSRRGPYTGQVVRIYQPEELKAMTVPEINRHIAEDLQLDAFEKQEREPAAYKGRNLARGIEHALVYCPSCKRLGTLQSRGDRFFCDCGLTGSYDRFGRLCGTGFAFGNIRDWDRWQREYLAGLPLEAEPERELTADEAMELLQVESHSRRPVAEGRLYMTARELVLGDRRIPLTEINDLSLRLHGIISFSLKTGEYFEIQKARRTNYSGRKYKLLFDRLAAGPGGEEAGA